MSPLRTLLVGCGLIAQAKHLPALCRLRTAARLVGLCDSDPARARNLARRAGQVPTYATFSTALKELAPELVLLCTPPQTHRPLGLEALRAGAHLFLEKPMALTTAECDALIQAAESARRQLCVAFSQSFHPAALRAKELVASGAIGELRGLELFLSTPSASLAAQEGHWVHRLPGGFLSETGPHVAHLAMTFLGPVEKASLRSRKQQPFPWLLADDLRMDLICRQGTCSATLLYWADDWAARMDLVGTRGRLSVDLEGGWIVRQRRSSLSPLGIGAAALSESVQLLTGLACETSRWLSARRRDGHLSLLDQFTRAIQEGSPSPVPPQQGREVTRVLEILLAGLRAP